MWGAVRECPLCPLNTARAAPLPNSASCARRAGRGRNGTSPAPPDDCIPSAPGPSPAQAPFESLVRDGAHSARHEPDQPHLDVRHTRRLTPRPQLPALAPITSGLQPAGTSVNGSPTARSSLSGLLRSFIVASLLSWLSCGCVATPIQPETPRFFNSPQALLSNITPITLRRTLYALVAIEKENVSYTNAPAASYVEKLNSKK